jgi:hypothetical protein
MKRLTRLALGAVSVALMTSAVSNVGSDAYAAGHAQRGHHHSVVHDGSPRVLLALGRLDHRLGGALRHRLTPLTAADATILRSNAVADRSAVESVATRYSTAPTRSHLTAARALLRSFHPERYVAASAILRRQARTAVAILQLRTRVAINSIAASQLSTARGLLDAIRARHFTARTDRAEMRDARLEVKVARGIVARVRAELAPGS